MSKKSKFVLACLSCGDEYTAKSELIQCPSCGGVGELTVSNYEDSGWGDNAEQEDEDIDNLAYEMFD